MYTVTEITRTTDQCPTQWEGKFDDGDWLYARYRWGHLTIYKSRPSDDNKNKSWIDWNNGVIFEDDPGEALDGGLGDAELVELTRIGMTYPPEFVQGAPERDRTREKLFDDNLQRLIDHFRAGGTFDDWLKGEIKS